MKLLGIEITHANKIIFPQSGITKLDVVKYYINASNHMIPYLRNRPLTLHRYPDGINKQGFYQKKAADYFPKFVKTIQVKTEDGQNTQIVCNNKRTLIYLANQGTIGFHVWLSRIDKINKPDKVVLDLDPSKDSFEKVKEATFLIQEFLSKKGIKSKMMISGKNGIHIWYHIRRTYTFDKVRMKVKAYAQELENKHPELFTTAFRKGKRDGKVFIDYLRNSYAQTSVCPYSLRPTNNASVATPLSFEELKSIETATQFHIKNIKTRL